MPPAFQEIVDACYQDLGCPDITYESFWQVYCDLRDKVDGVVPLSIITGLSHSILSEPAGAEDVPFALAHLKAPDLDQRNSVEVDEEEGQEDLHSIAFTIEDEEDQLY